MTNWRAPLVFLLFAVSLGLTLGLTGLPASAQPSAPQPDAIPEAAPNLRSQSPEEEAAQRQARLDELFMRLAQKERPDWESVRNQILVLWSQSGSASIDLLLLRAGKAMDSGDFELALKFLNDLVRLAPKFPEGWNKRATVYYLLNEFGHSVADIERALALEPRHFGALSGLGIILEQLGEKTGAMRAYRRGLEVHPNLPGANEGVERLSPDVDGREL